MVRFPSPQTPGRFKKIQKKPCWCLDFAGNFLGQSQPANISRKTQGTVQRRRSTSCLCAVVLNNVCPRWSNGSSTKIPTFCRKKMEAVSFGGFFSCTVFFSGGEKHERETHQNQAVLEKKTGSFPAMCVCKKKVHSNLFVSKRLFPIESM